MALKCSNRCSSPLCGSWIWPTAYCLSFPFLLVSPSAEFFVGCYGLTIGKRPHICGVGCHRTDLDERSLSGYLLGLIPQASNMVRKVMPWCCYPINEDMSVIFTTSGCVMLKEFKLDMIWIIVMAGRFYFYYPVGCVFFHVTCISLFFNQTLHFLYEYDCMWTIDYQMKIGSCEYWPTRINII